MTAMRKWRYIIDGDFRTTDLEPDDPPAPSPDRTQPSAPAGPQIHRRLSDTALWLITCAAVAGFWTLLAMVFVIQFYDRAARYWAALMPFVGFFALSVGILLARPIWLKRRPAAQDH